MDWHRSNNVEDARFDWVTGPVVVEEDRVSGGMFVPVSNRYSPRTIFLSTLAIRSRSPRRPV